MGKSKAKVTIYTIAEKVDVSAAAVSIVLSNRHVGTRISEATVEKIRRAAQELGYVPNLVARRLRSQAGTRQIDLAVITSFEAPLALIGEWVRRLQEAMDASIGKDTRFSVAIELFHAGRLREMSALLQSDRYNGMLITNTHPDDDRFLENTAFSFPVVVIGRSLKKQYCVAEAPEFVGRNAAGLLHRAGCKHPAIMHGTQLTEMTRNRLAAFIDAALRLWGRPPQLLVCDALTPEAANAALRAFLAAGGKIDGVFGVTDSLLQGVYRLLHEQKIKIPGKVSVVGIGDFETPTFFDPGLTTLADTSAAVAQAVPLLLQLIRGEQPGQHTFLVKPEPVLRGSVRNEKNC
ncbi:MAG: LacI family transcriptional regulator [Opitutaceae bacterium]|nr:LacI family transcriptional regulator [Opitutaceae bacterium]